MNAIERDALRSDYSAEGLRKRWNLEASDAGFKGSEYVDEPETVFRRVRDLQSRYHEAMKENVRLRRERLP